MKEFYVIINDQQQGPFSLEQLAELAITPQTDVWAEGMDDWQPAGDVPELTTLLQQQEFIQHMNAVTPPAAPPPYRSSASASGGAVPPPAAPQPSVPGPAPSVSATPKSPRKGNGWVVAVVIIALVVALLAFTCPSRQAHTAAIKEVTHDWVAQKVDAMAGDALGGFLGNMGMEVVGDYLKEMGVRFLNDKLNNFMDDHFEVSNYLVVSVGRFKLSDKTQTVSLGVLGKVFTFNTDDIDRVIFDKLGVDLGMLPGRDQSAAQQPPVVEDEPAETPQDEEFTEPEDTVSGDLTDEVFDALGELADSAISQGKRQAEKTAKEWARKQIEKHMK